MLNANLINSTVNNLHPLLKTITNTLKALTPIFENSKEPEGSFAYR